MIYGVQNESIMKPCKDLTSTKSSLAFSLLDTRSLPKHAIDIANDSIIYASDVMCLTETQIVPDQYICHVCHFIKDFNVIRNDSFEKIQTTAFYHRNEVCLIGFQGFP